MSDTIESGEVYDQQTIDDLLSKIALMNLIDDEQLDNTVQPKVAPLRSESSLYENFTSPPGTTTLSLPLTTGLNGACGVFQCPGTAHWTQAHCRPVERSNSAVQSHQHMATSRATPFNQSLPVAYPDNTWITSCLDQNNLAVGQHRSLARTSSDPIPTDNSYFFPAAGINAMDMGGAGAAGAAAACRYKTELCRPFEEHGVCKYGEKCQFAHGRQQLRVVSRHPKYKTDLCKTYHSTGLCPYGPRCHFIHESEEEGMVPQRGDAQRITALEERLRAIKEQELMLIQQQLQQRQQKQQQELLITALLQASRRHHLSQISSTNSTPASLNTTATSHFPLLTSTQSSSLSQLSPHYSSHSVCDSLDSALSSSSSVSDSPASSPSLSMFGSDEITTLKPAVESSPIRQSSIPPGFHLAESRRTSAFQPVNPSPSDFTDYNSSLPQSDMFGVSNTYSLFNDFHETQKTDSAVKGSACSYPDSDLSDVLLSLSHLPEDTTIKDILLVAELFRAVKANQQTVGSSNLYSFPAREFKDSFHNVEQFSI